MSPGATVTTPTSASGMPPGGPAGGAAPGPQAASKALRPIAIPKVAARMHWRCGGRSQGFSYWIGGRGELVGM